MQDQENRELQQAVTSALAVVDLIDQEIAKVTAIGLRVVGSATKLVDVLLAPGGAIRSDLRAHALELLSNQLSIIRQLAEELRLTSEHLDMVADKSKLVLNVFPSNNDLAGLVRQSTALLELSRIRYHRMVLAGETLAKVPQIANVRRGSSVAVGPTLEDRLAELLR